MPLTLLRFNNITINLDHLAAIEKNGSGTDIYVIGLSSVVQLDANYETVIEKLRTVIQETEGRYTDD